MFLLVSHMGLCIVGIIECRSKIGSIMWSKREKGMLIDEIPMSNTKSNPSWNLSLGFHMLLRNSEQMEEE